MFAHHVEISCKLCQSSKRSPAGVSSHRRPSATTKLVSLAWSWLSDAKWLSNIETMSKKAQKKKIITPRKLDHKDNLNTGYCESTVGWKPLQLGVPTFSETSKC